MKKFKKFFAAFAAAAMVLTSAIPAFAAEDRTAITSVKLHIAADLEDSADFSDMSLDVSADENNYYVDDYGVTSTTSSYPTIEVVLKADDGYYFDLSSKDVSLTGEKASLSSKSTKNSKETLTLKIKLTDITADLSEVEYAELNDDGMAYWEGVNGARKYQIRLYRNGSTVGTSIETTDTQYNFRSMITREGDYYFRVRALGLKSKDTTDWTESDEVTFDYALSSSSSSNNNSPAAATGWRSDSTGWWYQYADGSYPVNAWLYVDNNWFHFDGRGYMQTGWLYDNGQYYYLNPVSDGSQGRMITGWYWVDGQCYYFNPGPTGIVGAMAINTTIDGYRVGPSGAWIQ